MRLRSALILFFVLFGVALPMSASIGQSDEAEFREIMSRLGDQGVIIDYALDEVDSCLIEIRIHREPQDLCQSFLNIVQQTSPLYEELSSFDMEGFIDNDELFYSLPERDIRAFFGLLELVNQVRQLNIIMESIVR